MTDLATIRTSLEQCYDAIESLAGRMDATEWRTQSLCPDWDMRGVITHLGMMERVMTGWLPESADDTPPLDRIAPYHEQTAALDDAAFAARIAEIFAARRADLARLTEADLARPGWTPIGPRGYGGFLEMRIFDFWVHQRDITTPLGWPSDDGGPAAEIALAQVTGSIGYIVGKKIGLPDGASIVFHLTGPVKRDLAVVVDGRAKAVARVEHPDVELTMDTVTFIQLAAGRIDPQPQIDAGLVTWAGDARLADHAARNLRFTI
ncbi:MAG TPA: maleylpyruvate isomerase N-terminal domain-containing protein [Trebonia sp.]|nr:maleylpyruvate isomerase N-terminal domain-containing protein [Trebonia sp.]